MCRICARRWATRCSSPAEVVTCSWRRRVRSTPTVSRRWPPTRVARSPTVTLLARAKLLDAALGLWRGEPLADLAYEPFAQREIARLDEARLAALEDRIEADLMLGHDRDLVGELEALVAVHPHRERLLGQLMLALYRCGRQTDALAAYRKGRDALNDELGLEPGPELRALEQRILTHDPALEPPAPTAPGRTPTERGRSARGRGRALIAAGGALLLAAAIAAGIVGIAGGGVVTVRVAPNSVAAIDAHTDRVVGQVPVGTRPGAIAFGSGSLWVANLDDQDVSRVDPRTLRTLRSIPVRGGSPTGIATSPAGVWVVESDTTPTASLTSSVFVDRIDPEFDTPSGRVRIGNVIPSGPGVVAAQGDSVWVAPSTGLLTRLNPTTVKVADQRDPNASPAGIAIGDGAVWLTDTEADNVVRVDPTGLLTPIRGWQRTDGDRGWRGRRVGRRFARRRGRPDRPWLAVGDGDDSGRTVTCRNRVRGWVGVGRQQR